MLRIELWRARDLLEQEQKRLRKAEEKLKHYEARNQEVKATDDPKLKAPRSEEQRPAQEPCEKPCEEDIRISPSLF